MSDSQVVFNREYAIKMRNREGTFFLSFFLLITQGRLRPFWLLEISITPACQKNFHLTLSDTDSRFLPRQVSVSIENFRDGCRWCKDHADSGAWLSDNFRWTNLKMHP